MQLLFDKSFEFEKTRGLEFINGEVVKFSKIKTKKTHLGWNQFKIEENIDIEYKNTFLKVRKKGVKILCYNCKISPQEIKLDRPVKVLKMND